MTVASTFFIMMAIYHANGMKEQAGSCMIIGVIAAALQGAGISL